MRLIDADILKINLYHNKKVVLNDDLVKCIDDTETAYDINNVVAELERFPLGNLGCQELNEIIEIVKQGRVADDMCEWKVFDNSLTDEPQWVYKTTCGKYVGEEHTSKAFVYCPYCGKKIKVVGG